MIRKEQNDYKAQGKWKKIFVFCFLFSALWALFLSCQTDIKTIHLVTEEKNIPSSVMKDAEIIYSDSAKVRMKLTGSVLERFTVENPYVRFPNGVSVLFYDDSMKVSSTLRADYGIRYEKERRMEAKGNVEIVNVKNEKLNTEHLIWEEDKDSIYTKAFVKITTNEYVMWGDGLVSNLDFTRYKITNPKGTKFLTDEESAETPQ